ncbi:hypothetical protein B0O99DRAFT_694834 [Bisporella sp. PMI_857]|nr:hypothetical protein B0O99DRAFT_694834 [Bisporella sp. PMI_857]
MQTSSNESDLWQLFTSLQPLFASDIPWEVALGNQDDVSAETTIENTGDLIKACMLEIPAYVRMEHFDTLDGFALFIADDLRPFLLILQELVDDQILEYANVATIRNSNQKLLKLNALSLMIQSSITNVFDVKEYLKFLCLYQDPANLRNILASVENFNKRLMAEMSKSGTDRSAVSKSKTNGRSTSNTPMPWLQTKFNPSFWGSSQKLFKALVHNLGSCKLSTHSVMLNLKGVKPPNLQDEHTEFDILLSSCPKQGFWQEVLCRVIYKSHSRSDAEDDILPEDICQTVQIANDYSCMLHIHVYEESFQYKCCDDQQPLYPEALPNITMSQLIECGFLRDLRGFHLKDSLPKRRHFDKYPLLLSFGQFLLELANGERLPVATTKTGDFSPYKTLMENFNQINTGSLSDSYKEAIEGCLKFQKFVKNERGLDEEVRIRTTIFKKIVQPLERNLQLFSKEPISTKINGKRTRENRSLLDPHGPRDLHLQDGILLALPQVSDLLLSTTSHSPVPGAARQAISLEPNNHPPPSIDLSNSQSACVSRLQREACLPIIKKENVFLQTIGVEAKEAVCQEVSPTIAIQHLQHHGKRTSGVDALSLSETESEPDSDEAGGRLLGSFDTEESDLQESASLEWGRTFKTLSQIYGSRFQHTLSDEPVKVAIFDTGIDRTHPDFQYPRSKPKRSGTISPVRGEVEQIKRIKACQNFCDDRKDVEDVTDIDGHGTHVAGIILQLAPAAELYIARVCEGDERYGRSPSASKANEANEKLKSSVDTKKVYPSRVEKAMEWAIGHGVHLINMSFGYKIWDPKLDQALKKARDHHIVIFAAASNFGNHERVAWPARDPERAICVHSSIDLGTYYSKFTPKPHSGTVNFMVTGERVCSHWPVSKGGDFEP